MRNKIISPALVLFLLGVITSSCTREHSSPSEIFYGKWRSDAGDTITFSQRNGTDILTYGSFHMPPSPTEVPFSYQQRMLALKDDETNIGKMRLLRSFKWVQGLTSFEVRGTDFYLFMSSSSILFTFTRIP